MPGRGRRLALDGCYEPTNPARQVGHPMTLSQIVEGSAPWNSCVRSPSPALPAHERDEG
jgi:hypothetical protein